MSESVLTRKIQLNFDVADKSELEALYQTWFDYQNLNFRCYNIAASHLFFQEKIKELSYLTEEKVSKLYDIAKDEDGILNTSRQNSIYRVLSNGFKGQLPSVILSSIASSVYSVFIKESKEYFTGKRSLRSYRRETPIPFTAVALKRLQFDQESNNFHFNLFKTPFRTYLGADRSNNSIILDRIVAGEYTMVGSAIQILKGKIYLLLAFKIPDQQLKAEPGLKAEAILDIEVPIKVKLPSMRKYREIGTKESFLHQRVNIQNALHRKQKALRHNNGGHGRKKKLAGLEEFKKKETNYVNSRLHEYSRALVDFAIKNKCEAIVLKNQEHMVNLAKEKKEEGDDFLIRNWSYYGLIEMIAYKAKLAGIKVEVEKEPLKA